MSLPFLGHSALLKFTGSLNDSQQNSINSKLRKIIINATGKPNKVFESHTLYTVPSDSQGVPVILMRKTFSLWEFRT